MWHETTLGEIATFHKGKGLPKSKILEDGKYECIHYGELFTAYKENINKILSRTDSLNGAFLSKDNDVLMPTSDVTPRGLATASFIGKSNVVLGGDILIIRPDSEKLYGLYLAYLITANKHQILRLVSGSTVFHLYGSDMAKLKLRIPSVQIQTRVVNILQTWDEYLEKLDRKIEIKKNIKKGLMQQLLTGKTRLPGFNRKWNPGKLGQYVDIISGGTPSTENTSYWGGDINWITPSEITKLGKYIEKNTDKTITMAGLLSSSAQIIPPGSLILCSRATIAECSINKFEISTNQGFKNLVPKQDIDIEFLYYWVLNNRKAFVRISQGSTFLEFSKKDVEKIDIILPEIEEQKKIAHIIGSIDSEIDLLIQKKRNLINQKKYLLNNLVSGKIRVPESVETKEAVHA